MSLVYYTLPIIYHIAPRTTQTTFNAIRIECNLSLLNCDVVFKIFDAHLTNYVLIEKSVSTGGITIINNDGIARIDDFFIELKPGLYPYSITIHDGNNNRIATYLKGTITILPNI